MAIAFRCSCGRAMRAAPELAGKKTKCPGCGKIQVIPAPGDDTAPRPPAPKTSPSVSLASSDVVQCDGCQAKIRTKPEWAGKTIKCPKCEGRIKVPGGAPSPAAPAPKPAAKRPAPPPVEEPEEGGFGGFHDDEPAPAPPPKKGTRRPAPTPPPDEDEDDAGSDFSDNAAGKSPRSNTKPQKKGGGRALIYSILGLLLIAAGGAAYYVFLWPDAPTRTPPIISKNKDSKPKIDETEDPEGKQSEKKDPDGKQPETKDPGTKEVPKTSPGALSGISLVPGGANGFIVVRVGDFLKTPSGAKLLELAKQSGDAFEKDIQSKAGIGTTDIHEVVVVMMSPPFISGPSPDSGTLFIVTTSGMFDEAKIAEASDKKEVAGKTLYFEKPMGKEPPGEGLVKALHILSPKQVVIGGAAEIKGFLERNPADGPMTAMIKEAGSAKYHIYFGFQVPPELAEMAKKGAPKEAEGALPLAEVKEGRLTVLEEKNLKLDARLIYPDEAKAAAAKSALDGLVLLGGLLLPGLKQKGLPPEMEKPFQMAESALKSIKPSVEKEVMTVSAQLDTTVAELVQLGMMLMLRKGPPGGPEPKIEPATKEEKESPKLDPKESGEELKELKKEPKEIQPEPKVDPKGAAASDMTNLKAVALGFHGFHDANRFLPPAKFGMDMSWRVAILPYIDQADLFKKFNPEEPWDGPRNKALIEQMPKVYEHPTRKAPQGHTFYRVFVGPETLFRGSEMKDLQSIPRIVDGSSSTLLIVEAADAVPWTKFAELPYDAKALLPKLGNGQVFTAAMADGSTRVLKLEGADAVLRGIITPSGGELVEIETK